MNKCRKESIDGVGSKLLIPYQEGEDYQVADLHKDLIDLSTTYERTELRSSNMVIA